MPAFAAYDAFTKDESFAKITGALTSPLLTCTAIADPRRHPQMRADALTTSPHTFLYCTLLDALAVVHHPQTLAASSRSGRRVTQAHNSGELIESELVRFTAQGNVALAVDTTAHASFSAAGHEAEEVCF
jgi:hypothetical protein